MVVRQYIFENLDGDYLMYPQDEARFDVGDNEICITDAITCYLWAFGHQNRIDTAYGLLCEMADHYVMDDDSVKEITDELVNSLTEHLNQITYIARELTEPVYNHICQFGEIESVEDITPLDDGTFVLSIIHHPQGRLIHD